MQVELVGEMKAYWDELSVDDIFVLRYNKIIPPSAISDKMCQFAMRDIQV